MRSAEGQIVTRHLCLSLFFSPQSVVIINRSLAAVRRYVTFWFRVFLCQKEREARHISKCVFQSRALKRVGSERRRRSEKTWICWMQSICHYQWTLCTVDCFKEVGPGCDLSALGRPRHYVPLWIKIKLFKHPGTRDLLCALFYATLIYNWQREKLKAEWRRKLCVRRKPSLGAVGGGCVSLHICVCSEI